MNRAMLFLPVMVFIIMIGLFGNDIDDPAQTDVSPQIGKPMPAFSLPILGEDRMLTEKDIKGPALVNIFGSWCVACVEEHPIWSSINKQIPVYGIAWRDKPEKTKTWLDGRGNPYTVVASDSKSKFALDWGVTGAPETYVIDDKGIVLLKVVGIMTPEIWEDMVTPKLQALK